MTMEKYGKLLVMLLVKQKITRTLKKLYRPMVKLLQIKSLLPMNSINTIIQYQLKLNLT